MKRIHSSSSRSSQELDGPAEKKRRSSCSSCFSVSEEKTVLSLVFGFLDPTELCRAERVCKRWKESVEELPLWIPKAVGCTESVYTEAGISIECMGQLAAGDLSFLKSICIVRTLMSYMENCKPEYEDMDGLDYESFIELSNCQARTTKRLTQIAVDLLESLEKLAVQYCNIDLTFDPVEVSPTSCVEYAKFVLLMIGSICSHGSNIRAAAPPYEDYAMPLCIKVEPSNSFQLIMEPVNNTLHLGSFWPLGFGLFLENSVRAFKTFQHYCGFCHTVEQVENAVVQLLQLEEVVRDPTLSDCEHAHCLFKLAIYKESIQDHLAGLSIQPARHFSVSRCTGRMRLQWNASWSKK